MENFKGLVTVTRVAEAVLPIYVLSESFRNKVLDKALMEARILCQPKSISRVPALFGENVFGVNEDVFDKRDLVILTQIIEAVYNLVEARQTFTAFSHRHRMPQVFHTGNWQP